MTISSVSTSPLTQTLSGLSASSSVASSSVASTTSASLFATSLAQAASEMSASEGLLGTSTPGETLFSEALSEDGDTLGTDTGLSALAGSSNELSLISQLLSSQDPSISSPTTLTSPAASAATSQETALIDSAAAPLANGDNVVSEIDSAAAPLANGDNVVSEAAKFEGTPYVWGGTTPQGFDCSGLAQYVYAQLGVQLPRTSEEQASAGSAVSSLADAQPGDLVFFAGSDGTSQSPGHVGIYVGNGQMIDAPYTGTTVQEQSVSSAGPVVAIRRILPSTSSAPILMGEVSVPAMYASTIETAAMSNNIPSALLASLLQHESNFDPSALSSAGAQGIAQIMPATAEGLGVDPYDPTQAIGAAAHLLGAYVQRFGSYADALAAYNAGPNAVVEYGGIPPYAQTQAYVPEVLSSAGLSQNGGTPT